MARYGPQLLVLCAATVLTSCMLPTATRQSAADIRDRERVLFSQSAFYGITPQSHDRMIWQGRTGAESGDLILTPTTLYFVYHAGDIGGSRSIAISYAAITDARVEPVTGPPLRSSLIPTRSGTRHDNLLVIRTVDGGAGTTYAGSTTVSSISFHLIGSSGRWQSDRQAALNACSIIHENRKNVGVFGKRSRGGRAGLTTDSMSVTNWQLEEAMTACGISAAGTNRRRFLPPSTTWNDLFNRQCQAVVARNPAGRHIQPLAAIPPSSNFTIYAEKISRQHPELDNLIIISLRNTRFSADASRTRVTATYTYRIEYYDLRPAKPGSSQTFSHSVTRPAREWAAGGHTCIQNDLQQIATRAVTPLFSLH